jgi:hypothetical protein
MEQNLIVPEEEAIAQRMAERAGENTRTYTIMPTITVYNPSKTAQDSTLKIGDLVKTIRTEQGYETEKYERPFKGIILKVRMFLKLKYKYAEGKPAIVTNEFDSYADSEMIFVKEKGIEKDATFKEVFMGNYKQVNDKYSLKSDTEIEKKLDLHHAIYVLKDLESKEIVRIDSKGLSRSNFFDYMNQFSRRGGDFMSAQWTTFDSMVSDKDYKGKPRQAPIAAITFTKGEKNIDPKKAEEIQIEFEKQLLERDILFGSVKKEADKIEQPEPTEDIPTINLDEEPAQLLPGDEEDDGRVKIADVPF